MAKDECWTTLAAEYENACSRLTLIKPEIKPVFCHMLPPPEITGRLDLRPQDEYRRMMDELHMEELHGIEQEAKGLIHSYTSAKYKRHRDDLPWLSYPPRRFKRTGAKL